MTYQGDGPSASHAPAQRGVSAGAEIGLASPVREAGRPPETPQEVALDRLVEAISPLARTWFAAQNDVLASKERQQQRELEFEEKLLEHTTRRHRSALVVVCGLSAAVLAFAGFLIVKRQEVVAIDLLKLVIAAAGAGFGGYGIALSKRRRPEDDEE